MSPSSGKPPFHTGKLNRAGILTRLNQDGKPVVSPKTVDFTDIKVGFVGGYAPTKDTFPYNKNFCVEGFPQFSTNSTLTRPVDIYGVPVDGPQKAIEWLLSGKFDAVYMKANQLNQLIDSGDDAAKGFGTNFSYIHTGLNEWSHNGTTLAISKRGSGLPSVLNPCIDKIVRTPKYLEICEKYFESSKCIGGEGTDTDLFFDVPMNQLPEKYNCASGYCSCDE